jgi:ABC-type Mn2+/Zn2+ transport system ATPase subunit
MELIAGLILGFAVNKDLSYVGNALASNDSFVMTEWATTNIDFMDLVPPTWDRLSLGIILVKLTKADDTMELLGLTHIRDSIIGDELKRGISGGQRKRVNIGIEMVIDPALYVRFIHYTYGVTVIGDVSLCTQSLSTLAHS